jgi:hypothetical protein
MMLRAWNLVLQIIPEKAERTVTEENRESVKKSETYRTLIQVAKIDPVAAIENRVAGG